MHGVLLCKTTLGLILHFFEDYIFVQIETTHKYLNKQPIQISACKQKLIP